jgi:hypothetical protein
VSMSGKRTKFIRIRISEPEFQILRQACERTGTKTVVQLARDAMHYLVETHKAEPTTSRDTRLWLRELVCRLTSLQVEVERLEQLLKVHKMRNAGEA